jgi:hypothetical protein
VTQPVHLDRNVVADVHASASIAVNRYRLESNISATAVSLDSVQNSPQAVVGMAPSMDQAG